MKKYYSIFILNSRKSWIEFASGFSTFEEAAVEVIQQAKKPFFKYIRNNPIKIAKIYNNDRRYLDERIVFKGRIEELPNKIKNYVEN